MNNNQMVVDHGVEGLPKGSIGFIATLSQDRRKISVLIKNSGGVAEGRPKSIKLNEGDSAIDMFCPSQGGQVIWCLLVDGHERFFRTKTGRRLIPTQNIKGRQVFRPVFYS